jgi:hypothetical protein
MIIGVGTWRGTGSTTTAMLIARMLAAQGDAPWLIEADPAGGALAGRLPLAPEHAGGLERIAFPAGRLAATERFDAAFDEIYGVRVVTAPGDPFRAWACHTPRLAWAPALRELDGPVLIDLGRMRGGAPTGAVLEQLDVLLLTTTPDPVSLVSTLEWARLLGRVSPADVGLPLDLVRLAVVDLPIGHGRVPRSHAEDELGDRFAGWLPWAPDVVDLIIRGADPTDRRLRRQPLIQAVEHTVGRLRDWAPIEALP